MGRLQPVLLGVCAFILAQTFSIVNMGTQPWVTDIFGSPWIYLGVGATCMAVTMTALSYGIPILLNLYVARKAKRALNKRK